MILAFVWFPSTLLLLPLWGFFSSKKTRTALLGHIQEASFHTEELSLLQIAQLLTPSQSVSPTTCNKTRENYRTQKLFTALEGGTRRINTTLGNWFILVAKQSILFTKICIRPFNVAEQKNYTIMVGRHELLHPWVSNSVPELWELKSSKKKGVMSELPQKILLCENSHWKCEQALKLTHFN